MHMRIQSFSVQLGVHIWIEFARHSLTVFNKHAPQAYSHRLESPNRFAFLNSNAPLDVPTRLGGNGSLPQVATLSVHRWDSSTLSPGVFSSTAGYHPCNRLSRLPRTNDRLALRSPLPSSLALPVHN